MDTPCIRWTGRIDKYGYGRRTWRGDTSAQAHRAAYEQEYGPIPDGMTVDHLCFNPPCVNPKHLRLLTRSENARNQRSAHKSRCVNGHEFTPENTYQRPSGGQRDCRACIRDRVARYRSRRAAA